MKEFIQKVANMRKLQKRYFKDRDRNTLLAAKEAELAVDEALEEMDRKNRQEPTLFE